MVPHTARFLLGGGAAAPADAVLPGDLGRRLGEVPVELRVILGQADFSLDEVASLQVGDVIALEQRSPDPVSVLIDGRFFARARTGLSGQRIALELLVAPQEEGAS
jgi:flagellar motor switch protein FliM